MPTVTVTTAGESTSVDYALAATSNTVFGSGFGGWFSPFSYTLNGATYSTTENKPDAYSRIVAKYGTLKVSRLFGGMVNYVDPSTRLFWEPSTFNDAACTTLAARGPGQFISDAHEPGNKGYTPATWAALQNQRQTQLENNGTDGPVSLVPVLMGGTGIPGRTGDTGGRATDWFAGCDFSRIRYIGADLYQFGKSATDHDNPADVFGPWIALARQYGVQLVAGEFGARRPDYFYGVGIPDQTAADYINGVAALCDAERYPDGRPVVAAVCAFESNNGSSDMIPWNLLPPPGWTTGTYRPLAIAAYAALCKR